MDNAARSKWESNKGKKVLPLKIKFNTFQRNLAAKLSLGQTIIYDSNRLWNYA